MLKRFSRVLAASALLAGSLAGMAHADQPVINFGIISTESSQNLKSIWEPFLKDMSQQTGYQVKAFFAPDYAGIIQGMRFDKVDIAWYGNKVDIAWYGNKAAMEAVDRAHGEIFAQTVAASGAPGYWSLLIANKDSKIDSVEDMLANAKSLTFGNGDPNSTSGYLVPGYYVFAKNNVDPVKAFKRTLNSSHEVNALAVANKQVDVATFNTEGMERLELTQPEKARQLKVIWKSPLIPGDPLVWRNNLSDEQKNKLRDFFFKYGANAEQKKVLADLQWSKFQPSDDDQLLPIRQLELFKQRTDVANNANLGAEEKAAKLKALDEELAKLEKRMAEREQKTAANAG
ncbi:phosphonate ABC transporter substrate-binding protein [Pseudomonas aeruginosa]|uniref:phosphonate ABC transporter substrate-binding protein n=8 Tax=Gammaproteobacteria TaxID=1236 RepID=UPI0026DF7A34|nr:phosphonate ABC transporter substrate-binding protein [Pseudomonas aeruginosa]MDO5930111.1 phosphonate ABC transporter substrate-binding protein [Pseudomonas aeruginosa]HCP6234597.1 phosphonate ABC transporter substrate-binding protein [Pseudomonas aeruginosa]